MTTLPKLNTPQYKLKLLSDGREIDYRPFLVKEEKILLMAIENIENMESDSEKESVIISAVKQIIENCTFNQIDVNKLPLFDLEWLFIHLRMKSKGEFIEFGMMCQRKDENGHKCGHVNKISYNLSEVEIKNKDIAKDANKIMLQGDIGIVLKYPTFEMLNNNKKLTTVDATTALLKQTIDCIFEGDNVISVRDITEEELDGFIESMSPNTAKKIQDFFDSLPTITGKVSYKCAKCSAEEKNIPVTGLLNFLD